MIRCSLRTAGINRIDLCMTGIKVHFHYCLDSHVSHKNFNIAKSVLFVKKSTVSQPITLNKSVMMRKRRFLTANPSLRHDKVISKKFNTKSASRKVLTMMIT